MLLLLIKIKFSNFIYEQYVFIYFKHEKRELYYIHA